jgi:hypothetical protein
MTIEQLIGKLARLHTEAAEAHSGAHSSDEYLRRLALEIDEARSHLNRVLGLADEQTAESFLGMTGTLAGAGSR